MKHCRLAGKLLEGPKDPCDKLADVVFAHCLLGNRRNFGALASQERDWQGEAWLPRRRRFAVDLRNHGDSPSEDSMGVHELALDLLAWLEEARVQKPLLVGHSLGGKVVMEAALLAPELVSGIAVLDVAPVAYTQPELLSEPVSVLGQLEGLLQANPDSEEALDYLLEERFPDMEMFQVFLSHAVRFEKGRPRLALNVPVIKRSIPDLFAHKPRQAVYRGPAVFLYGRKSSFFTQEAVPCVRKFFPELNPEKHIKAFDCGHYLPFKRPFEVAQIVEQLARQL